jgi:mono/diheme cytochrome c family protein
MRARIAVAALAFASLSAPALAQDHVQGAPVEQGGEALFVEKCGMCHREVDRVGGMGTFLIERRDPNNEAMLERRALLTPEYIAAAIRVGIGNMPRISRAEVSDAQLAAIAEYLVESAAAYAPPPAEAEE